jgi:transcription antitermination factor NusG
VPAAQKLFYEPGFSPNPAPAWYAIQTYPRFEKRVAGKLTLASVENYLPLYTRVHGWSDRQKKVDLPLFPCYAFVRISSDVDSRVRVLQMTGVVQFVGGSNQHPIAVPLEQIENIRTLLANKISLDPYPFLKAGQRVRIRGGALNGIEGILVRRNGMRRLIISVSTLERSLSLSVEGLDVEGI